MLTGSSERWTIQARFFHFHVLGELVLDQETRLEMKKTHDSSNCLGPWPVDQHCVEAEKPTCEAYHAARPIAAPVPKKILPKATIPAPKIGILVSSIHRPMSLRLGLSLLKQVERR